MIVTTPDLLQGYTGVIDRLDQLYSAGLRRMFTEAEQAEIAELRQRARLIEVELSERQRNTVLLLFV